MKFRFKICLADQFSYEEDYYISDDIANKLIEDHELDEFLRIELGSWVENNINYEWEKVYGED